MTAMAMLLGDGYLHVSFCLQNACTVDTSQYCLHPKMMPQVHVATNSLPTHQMDVSALAVALVECANMQRPGADRSHCLPASPATGAAARFLLVPCRRTWKMRPLLTHNLSGDGISQSRCSASIVPIMDHGSWASPGQSGPVQASPGRLGGRTASKAELQPPAVALASPSLLAALKLRYAENEGHAQVVVSSAPSIAAN